MSGQVGFIKMSQAMVLAVWLLEAGSTDMALYN